MIKQKDVVIKTSNSTLIYSEMGDIVCNSASAINITLPSPNSGLWYRISNVGVGLVTVLYNTTTLTTLKQKEQRLCLANNTSSWFLSNERVLMTKAEIEAILTGEITSHNHADNVLTGTITPTTSTVGTIGQFYLDTAIPKLYQCTAIDAGLYIWTEIGGGSGSYTLPQATEMILGGIKASEKTTAETSEVKIDSATGKLYSTPPTSALNGLPAGGIAGQVPIKNSDNDYDYSWGDASGGGEFYYVKNTTQVVFDPTPILFERVPDMLLIIPASNIDRTILLSAFIQENRTDSNRCRHELRLDSSAIISELWGIQNSESKIWFVAISNVIIDIPGDNQPHTISLWFNASGSTNSTTFKYRSMVAQVI